MKSTLDFLNNICLDSQFSAVDAVVLFSVLLDGDVGQVDVHVVHLAHRVVVLDGAEPAEAVLVQVHLPDHWGQGGRIGLIFAYWAIVFFGQFFENYTRSTNFGASFFTDYATYVLILTKNSFGYIKGNFFHKLIWGRCYYHNFLRFSTIFGKKLAFFSNTNVMIKIFHNLALF
jgi:hypothetical protein